MKTSLFAFTLLFSAQILAAGSFEQDGAFVRWTEDQITVGNRHFMQQLKVTKGGFQPVSIRLSPDGMEWVATRGKKNLSVPFQVDAHAAAWSPAGATGVCARVLMEGKTTTFWVFPDVAATFMDRNVVLAMKRPDSKNKEASGIELADQKKTADEEPALGLQYSFRPEHLRLTEFRLRDQTDNHNELLQTREWLLMPNEANLTFDTSLLSVEETLTENGLAFLRVAPLPHARARTRMRSPDFLVHPVKRQLTVCDNGYPVAVIPYAGGAAGRTCALQAFQRALRLYRPGRDGLFLSNTWGDRSRDARIRESFLLKEVAAGAKLGVDVIQIDDGWQKGRSANSVASRGKGVWNGYWAADPHFWDPDPERFPNGLEAVVNAAKKEGMGFGLWFGPDSSNDAANWQRDADHLLSFYRNLGVRYFKIDSMKTFNALSLQRQRMMFNRMISESNGDLVFDLDVTAEIRPGYFGLPDIGTIFVENRYTDFHRYWPHQTLRNLWMLSQVVDPVRLRMEVLNPLRNQQKYQGDPLAPACYRADTLFAMVMVGSPLGWFEISNLQEKTVAEMRPLIQKWKTLRHRIHGGHTIPIGAAPDGVAWTGFATLPTPGQRGMLLLFREANRSATYRMPIQHLFPNAKQTTVLAGRGSAQIQNGELTVTIPEKLDFVWFEM